MRILSRAAVPFTDKTAFQGRLGRKFVEFPCVVHFSSAPASPPKLVVNSADVINAMCSTGPSTWIVRVAIAEVPELKKVSVKVSDWVSGSVVRDPERALLSGGEVDPSVNEQLVAFVELQFIVAVPP